MQSKEFGIVSYNKRTDDTMTIQFDNTASAAKFETETVRKIGNDLVVSKITPYQPDMKIVGFSDVVTPISELITDVCVQNGINPDDIQLVREYKIDVTRRTYRNAIVRCTIDVLTKYTTTGVTLNGRSHRCFEQVKVLQCYKC